MQGTSRTRHPRILLVDTCTTDGFLHPYEFVNPVLRCVREAGAEPFALHYRSVQDELFGSPRTQTEICGVIICGSALGDNEALRDIRSFTWIGRMRVPILGIGQGMVILSVLNGGSYTPSEEIGLTRIVKLREDPVLGLPGEITVYELHSIAPTLPPGFTALARNETAIQAFRSQTGEVRGVLFHPEVRNREIIHRFVEHCIDGKETRVSHLN